MVIGSFIVCLLGWHCIVLRVDANILEEFTVFSIFCLSVTWRDVCWTMTQDLEKSNHTLFGWWYLTAKAQENTKPVRLDSVTGQHFTVHVLNTSLKHYFYINLIPWVQEITLRHSFMFLWPCIVSKVWRKNTNKMQQYRWIIVNFRCWLLTTVSTCFGHLYAHHQEKRPRVTAYGVYLLAVLDVAVCGTVVLRWGCFTVLTPST